MLHKLFNDPILYISIQGMLMGAISILFAILIINSGKKDDFDKEDKKDKKGEDRIINKDFPHGIKKSEYYKKKHLQEK